LKEGEGGNEKDKEKKPFGGGPETQGDPLVREARLFDRYRSVPRPGPQKHPLPPLPQPVAADSPSSLGGPSPALSHPDSYIRPILDPIRETMTTRVVEMRIMMIPRAESLPQRPSSAKRRI